MINFLSKLFMQKMIKTFQNITPKIHSTAYIAENAVIIGDVEIGEQASIWYNCVLRGDVNFIRIGAKTNIQDGTIIHVSREAEFAAIIEAEVTVGHSATIHGCYIEQGSLIGIGATVLDGARVGKNSLIAAGSLVTPNTIIPERSFVLGSPARVKRELSDEEVENIQHFWRNYVKLSEIYRGESQ
jgi:carbonic anhydrase/acetyltransferase-like protein (isoleucine patch superfamily)